jgi:hypothetical protein
MAYTIVPAGGTSNQIVKLSATPPVRLTAGQGGASMNNIITGYGLAPVNMPTTNFLPLVRIPSNAIIKKVDLMVDVAPSTSLTGSLGLCFSNVLDGTSPPNLSVYALTAAVPAVVSQSFFLYQTAIQTYTKWTDVTFGNATGNSVTDGYYVMSASNQPVWQALSNGGASNLGQATSGAAPGAFTSCQTDPGGFFDIVWFETTTGVNTAAVNVGVQVSYCMAAQ